MKKYLPFLLLSLFIGCGTAEKYSEYYEIPKEMSNPESHQKILDTYSPYLKGVKIFIDPGHGGTERGARSSVIEAELNLRVALALRGFLEEAGAIVTMSRTADSTVGLVTRSDEANQSGCDMFISVHHNAPGGKDNQINYTSTYYHAMESDYEFNPCNKDIAKYVQRDISYATRNSGGPGSFDGTYSDYSIYPKKGFSVLRLTNLPSVLVEASFVTSRLEQKRLANETYNRIEAWGIFKGLSRYFSQGIPTIEQLSGNTINKNEIIVFKLYDKSGIDPNSIKTFIDSTKIHFIFEPESNKLMIPTERFNSGEHELNIIIANKNGNHSFPFRKNFIIK